MAANAQLPFAPGAPALGVVAFSFGKRSAAEEPNPSNAALAQAVERLCRRRGERPTYVVAQWEVAKGLRRLGVGVDLVVQDRTDGGYLSTDDVWEAAREFFTAQGVVDVAPVAQPFLHLRMVKRLIRAGGCHVTSAHVGRIAFDDSISNQQWWTRDRLRLVAYSGLHLLRRSRRLLGRAGSSST